MLEFLSPSKVLRFSRTRSVDRDAGSDHARVELISRSIEWSLRTALAEQAGLIRRLQEITTRALVPLGNGTDEYLTRDALDSRRLDQFEQEILRSEDRLEQLAHDIAHFESLKTALTVEFPDFKPSSGDN